MNQPINHEMIEPADFEADWIVNLDTNPEGARRIRVRAYSEQSAILRVEEEFGVTAISARLA